MVVGAHHFMTCQRDEFSCDRGIAFGVTAVFSLRWMGASRMQELMLRWKTGFACFAEADLRGRSPRDPVFAYARVEGAGILSTANGPQRIPETLIFVLVDAYAEVLSTSSSRFAIVVTWTARLLVVLLLLPPRV